LFVKKNSADVLKKITEENLLKYLGDCHKQQAKYAKQKLERSKRLHVCSKCGRSKKNATFRTKHERTCSDSWKL